MFVTRKTYGNLMRAWRSLAPLGIGPTERLMSILNRTLPRSTGLGATLRSFHSTKEFSGYTLVLALAGLTAVVSLLSQAVFR
jgi:hypothetical protein